MQYFDTIFDAFGLFTLQGHKPLYTNEDVAEYNVTNLNNGFTVLTES
jgi:hypothetical protein